MMAKMRRKRMKKKLSRLFAVTRFTPNRIVFSNFPCDVLNPLRSTNATQPLSLAKKTHQKIARLVSSQNHSFDGAVFVGIWQWNHLTPYQNPV